jgi:hypothetical protein
MRGNILLIKNKHMTKELHTYTELCTKYGTETIDALDSFIYWQIQYKGRVNVNNTLVSVDDYFKFYNKKPTLFAGYDYEDDAFTFGQWMQHQAEIEYNKMAEIE